MLYGLIHLSILTFCLFILFSKNWRRDVRQSVPSWMEDMTTSSVLWPHAWDWRRLMWKMPYWRVIRYLTLKVLHRFLSFVHLNRKIRLKHLWRYFLEHSFLRIKYLFSQEKTSKLWKIIMIIYIWNKKH